MVQKIVYLIASFFVIPMGMVWGSAGERSKDSTRGRRKSLRSVSTRRSGTPIPKGFEPPKRVDLIHSSEDVSQLWKLSLIKLSDELLDAGEEAKALSKEISEESQAVIKDEEREAACSETKSPE